MPSILDKITKVNSNNPFDVAKSQHEFNTFEQKAFVYQDNQSDKSNGVNAQPCNRNSWINNTRGRESFIDDTKSEKDKMRER